MARTKAVKVMPDENEDPFEIAKAQEPGDDYPDAIIQSGKNIDNDYPEFDAVGSDSLGTWFYRVREGLLSRSEEVTLAKAIEAGSQTAREQLANHNLGLVPPIAKKFRGRGVPFEELVSEGNVGLMRAVDGFDYRRGKKFSTYATFQIEAAIYRAIADQSRTIRVPEDEHQAVIRLSRAKQSLEQQGYLTPDEEVLANELDWTPDKVKERSRIARQYCVSLSTPFGDDERTFEDFLGDETAQDPQQLAVNMVRRRQLLCAMASRLSPREQAVILLRYGFFLNEPATCEACSPILFLAGISGELVTWERMRQVQTVAEKKLRQFFQDPIEQQIGSRRQEMLLQNVNHLYAKLAPHAERFIRLYGKLTLSLSRRMAVEEYYFATSQSNNGASPEVEKGREVLFNLEDAFFGTRSPELTSEKVRLLLSVHDKMHRNYIHPRSGSS